MRVALVHDWLTGMRGGEKVLEALLELFPDAEIFTLLHVPGSVSPEIEARPIHTSFVQGLPGAARHYRRYLPLFPAAMERFDLSGFDLVVSCSHCVAKGVRSAGAPHLSYCNTPMRYVWDQYDAYFGPGRAGLLTRSAATALAPRLRKWDRATATRVDRFVANSAHVRERIRRFYGREASVVHPPVDVSRFSAAAQREDFYLIVSALVPYKLVDLAVEAFRTLERPLVVVGSGPEMARLRRLAGPRTRFTGWAGDEEVASLMGRCRALVMPGVEDFGIVPVEAQAAGAPVIAFSEGGAVETVRAPDADGRGGTGVFFHDPSPRCLARAVRRLETLTFDPAVLRENAERFSRERFLEGMRRELNRFPGAVLEPYPSVRDTEAGDRPPGERVRLARAGPTHVASRRPELPYESSTVPVLGVPVRLRTNAPELLEAFEGALGRWRVLEAYPRLLSGERVEGTLLLDRGDEEEERPVPVRYTLERSGRLVIATQGSVVVGDASRREFSGGVTRALLDDRVHFRHRVLEAAVFSVVTHLDRQPLHASALVRDGAALLLAGPSGTGKSTLAYAAARAGFQVLSEDTVFVQLRPGLRVWAMPGSIHVPEEARRHFPELAGVPVRRLPTGKQKVSLSLRELRAEAPLPFVERAGICMVERVPGGGVSSKPLGLEALVSALLGNREPGFDLFDGERRELAEALSLGGGWRLTLSDDPDEALPVLHRLLDEVEARVPVVAHGPGAAATQRGVVHPGSRPRERRDIRERKGRGWTPPPA